MPQETVETLLAIYPLLSVLGCNLVHSRSQCNQEMLVTQSVMQVWVDSKENFWITVILTTRVDLNYNFKSVFF